MSNFFTPTSKDSDWNCVRESLFTLKSLMLLQGFKYPEDFKVFRVPVTFHNPNGYILTIEIGRKPVTKPVLVLIHGFCGSNFFFLKMFKELAKTFHIYAIDIYGMGLSYKWDFKSKDWESSMKMMTESINEWVKFWNLQNFFILGYSLGGYILMHYLNRFRPKLKGVFILSAPGFVSPEEAGEEFVKEHVQKYIGDSKSWVSNGMSKLMYN
jgi:pimeloyl-ACP methyl ester carboxylesterase